MRTNNEISPSIAAVIRKRYSKGRQNNPASGGLGRGSGAQIQSHLGDLYGQGIGRGGGGIGPIFGNTSSASNSIFGIDETTTDTENQSVDISPDVNTTSSNPQTSTVTSDLNKDTMDIDIESSLQQAATSSSALISSFMEGVVATEQHNNVSVSQVATFADQWSDAEEEDKKISGSTRPDPLFFPIAGQGNDITQVSDNMFGGTETLLGPPNLGVVTHTSLSTNSDNAPSPGYETILGTPTPGVATYASVGTSSANEPMSVPDTSAITNSGTSIVTPGHTTAAANNPYRKRNNGRRQMISGPPTISQYNITVRPKQVTNEFQIEYIIGSLLQAMQQVDPSAAILPHTDKSAPKLLDITQLPQTDTEMDMYIEDPRTSSTGKFGKLSARLTFETSVAFPVIKRNPKFATYIRQEGLYFDKSELSSPRIKYIGFFDKKLPHGTRIPFFNSLVRKLVNISKPFQILSTLVKASEDSEVQAYAYLLVAAPADEECILQEMSHFRCSHTNFYGWESFKDNKITSLQTRESVLIEMRDYVTQHMSLIFTGFQENVFMRATAATTQPVNPATVGDTNFYSVLQDDDDEDMDSSTKFSIINANPDKDDLDETLKSVNMLDFIQTYFVDVHNESIFVQIYGPANHQIEVHYEAVNHLQVQAVEEILIETLHIFMSNDAKALGLYSNPATTSQVTDNMQSRETRPSHNNRRSRRNFDQVSTPSAKRNKPTFRKTSHSNATYHSASIAGIHKVDIPSTLAVSQQTQNIPPIPSHTQASYASVTISGNSMQTSQHTNFKLTSTTDSTSISTTPSDYPQRIVDQIKDQIRLEFDEQFRSINKTMTAIQGEASEAKIIATNVAKQLNEKQDEVIVTIDTLQKGINDRFIKQETISAETNVLLERLVSATNLSSQQQHPFQYQPPSHYQHPQQFNPYYMPPVIHLPPHQQTHANKIASLSGQNVSHIHNGYRHEDITVAAVAK